MESPLYYVDPDMVNAVASANSYNWDIPDYANRKGDPYQPGGQASWNEVVEIMDSSLEPDQNDPSQVVARVKFAVSGSSTSPNVGKPALTQWFRWSPAALRDKSHEKYKVSAMNLDKLLRLLRATGVEVGGGLDIGAFLNEQGGTKWLVGRRLTALLRHYWYKNKTTGADVQKQEFVDFVATS